MVAPTSVETPRPARGRLDGWSIAAAALALYAVLGQDVFYKWDGIELIVDLRAGKLFHPHHPLLLPLAALAKAVLGPLGLGDFEVARALSAAGAAAGVLLAHGAFVRLGLGRGHAALAALLVATCPAVVFFATVVEFHGPFLAVAGLSLRAATTLAIRPSTRAAFVAGACTWACWLMHATGLLVPIVLLPWLLAVRRERALLAPALIAAATHGALVAATALACRLFFALDPASSATGMLGQYRFEAGALATVLWREWVVAFAPLSLLVLAGFRARGERVQVVALLVALVPYLCLCAWLIAANPEHGAYLLPFAFPAAAVAARRVPRSVSVIGAAAALALAVSWTRAHESEQQPYYDAFGARVRERAAGRAPSVVTVHAREVAVLARRFPDAGFLSLRDLTILRGLAAAPSLLVLWIRGEREKGRCVLMTDATRKTLLGVPEDLGKRVLEHVRATYELTAVSGEPRVFELSPR